jgi:hypothetical protein
MKIKYQLILHFKILLKMIKLICLKIQKIHHIQILKIIIKIKDLKVFRISTPTRL